MKHLSFLLVILFLTACNSTQNDRSHHNNTMFIWDFSTPKKLIYSFSQAVETEHQMLSSQPAGNNVMQLEGKLNVRIKENGLANLSLMDMEFADEAGNAKSMSSFQPPTMVIQDMKPNGSFEDPNSEMLFKIVFPLPSVDLQPGESEQLPLKMPFNAGGSRLFVKGYNELTFEGFDTIEGKKCAKLQSAINISELEIPEELSTSYQCEMQGKATYYFDTDNHYYIGADIQLLMSIGTGNDSNDNSEETHNNMWMKSNNVYKVRLLAIEE